MAARYAGRIKTILVDEGDFVTAGQVVGPGGRVLNMIDLNDVYMTFFL